MGLKRGWGDGTHTEPGAAALPGSFFSQEILDRVLHSHPLVHALAEICRD